MLHLVRDSRVDGTIEREVFDVLMSEKVVMVEDGRRRNPSPVRFPVRPPQGGDVGGHRLVK